MGQIIMQIQPVDRQCFKCGYRAVTPESRCPRCRRRLRSTGEVRGLGLVLMLLGGFITGLMAVIGVFMIGAMSSRSSTGPRFTGSATEGLAALSIIAFVILFGVVSFIAGLWQLIFGTRNKIFLWTVIVIAVVLYVGGSLVLAIFDR